MSSRSALTDSSDIGKAGPSKFPAEEPWFANDPDFEVSFNCSAHLIYPSLSWGFWDLFSAMTPD
jgi:hypothetical protein